MTKIVADVKEVWDNSGQDMNTDGGFFTYSAKRVKNPKLAKNMDVKAMTDKVISITPCHYEMTHYEILSKVSQDLELPE